eukprot:2375179-Amphidinium_carterae.2
MKNRDMTQTSFDKLHGNPKVQPSLISQTFPRATWRHNCVTKKAMLQIALQKPMQGGTLECDRENGGASLL